MKRKLRSQTGFTLIELLVVMVVIGIIMAIVLVAAPRHREKTYYTRGVSELNTMGNALKFYVDKYNEYPPDVVRDIPPGIEEFIAAEEDWPDAPWPGSVYDYDNHVHDGKRKIQIGIRFCPYGGAPDSLCNYPDEPWAEDFDSYSAMYYCITGPCRSHADKPANHPGYCVNCAVQPSGFITPRLLPTIASPF